MNTPENDDLHTLLRLKKHEQPPPAYFENFLAEFQRRQRVDLMRRSVWQLGWDRVQAFFETDRRGAFGYAMATAAVLIVASITAVNIVSPRVSTKQSLAHTSQPDGMTLALRPVPTTTAPQTFPAFPALTSNLPHYVIDARPVSYEPPSSF